mmetsp:Transcript_19892/g.48834  ORF Transcript_19892/g.48834 Transcript_19892/m.48834 type:complete len:379 (-) Transcript_19892:86-1222(-)
MALLPMMSRCKTWKVWKVDTILGMVPVVTLMTLKLMSMKTLKSMMMELMEEMMISMEMMMAKMVRKKKRKETGSMMLNWKNKNLMNQIMITATRAKRVKLRRAVPKPEDKPQMLPTIPTRASSVVSWHPLELLLLILLQHKLSVPSWETSTSRKWEAAAVVAAISAVWTLVVMTLVMLPKMLEKLWTMMSQESLKIPSMKSTKRRKEKKATKTIQKTRKRRMVPPELLLEAPLVVLLPVVLPPPMKMVTRRRRRKRRKIVTLKKAKKKRRRKKRARPRNDSEAFWTRPRILLLPPLLLPRRLLLELFLEMTGEKLWSNAWKTAARATKMKRKEAMMTAKRRMVTRIAMTRKRRMVTMMTRKRRRNSLGDPRRIKDKRD